LLKTKMTPAIAGMFFDFNNRRKHVLKVFIL